METKDPFYKTLAVLATAAIVTAFFLGYHKLARVYDYQNLVARGEMIEGQLLSIEPGRDFLGQRTDWFKAVLTYSDWQKQKQVLEERWALQAARPGDKIRLYYYGENGFIKASSKNNQDFPRAEKERKP